MFYPAALTVAGVLVWSAQVHRPAVWAAKYSGEYPLSDIATAGRSARLELRLQFVPGLKPRERVRVVLLGGGEYPIALGKFGPSLAALHRLPMGRKAAVVGIGEDPVEGR